MEDVREAERGMLRGRVRLRERIEGRMEMKRQVEKSESKGRMRWWVNGRIMRSVRWVRECE